MQQTNHTEQNSFGRLDRTPSLSGRLVPVFIVLGRVQDGDADEAAGVDVWVEGDGGVEGHGWWEEGVGGGKGEAGGEIGSCFDQC